MESKYPRKDPDLQGIKSVKATNHPKNLYKNTHQMYLTAQV